MQARVVVSVIINIANTTNIIFTIRDILMRHYRISGNDYADLNAKILQQTPTILSSKTEIELCIKKSETEKSILDRYKNSNQNKSE